MNTWPFSKKGMKTLLAAERGRQELKGKASLQAFQSVSHSSSIICWEGIWERESLCVLCPLILYSNPVLTWAATKVSAHNSSLRKKSTCTASSWHQSAAQERLQGAFYELQKHKWKIILASGKYCSNLHHKHGVTSSAQSRASCAGCEHYTSLLEQKQCAATADDSWYLLHLLNMCLE